MPPVPRAAVTARATLAPVPSARKDAHRATAAPATRRERQHLAVSRSTHPRRTVAAAAALGSCPVGFSPPPPPEDETATTTSNSAASKKRSEELEAAASLPRPTGSRRRLLPFIGETQPHLQDHLKWALERVWRHGPVFRSSLYGMRDVVVATDFASIEKVMSGEHVLTEWFQPASFQRLLGTASSAAVMADKGRHARQRRQQAKAFSPAALASYAPRVARETEAAVALWARRCEGEGESASSSSSSSPSSSLDLGEALSDLTWAYALATVVDVSLDEAEAKEVRAAWKAFTSNLFSAPLDFPGSRFRTALRARETLGRALGRAVREYQAEFERERAGGEEHASSSSSSSPSSSRPPTMMNEYMRARADDGDPLREEELVDMAIGLLLAGYETSHSAHLLLLSVLASPSLPSRVREALEREQSAVIAKHETALSAAALADMPYADACSKWCLWALGPADGIFRRAIADFELGGRRVQKGEIIYNSFLAAKAQDEKVVGPGGLKPGARLPPPHMDVNDLAASFAPERFLGGGGGDVNGGEVASAAAASDALAAPTSVATFGFGNHFCLGAPLYSMEAKALVATLVRGYEIGTADGGEPMRFASSWAATGRSGQRVRVKVSRRAAPL